MNSQVIIDALSNSGTLDSLHLDALTEVFNIGRGRAARSLSEIVGYTIQLSVPELRIVKTDEINLNNLSLNKGRFGAVTQYFHESFNGEVMLLFTEEHALEIVRDMIGSSISIEDLADFENEAMCELGNIILNACLSAMADVLSISMGSSLPSYSVATDEEVLRRIKGMAKHPYSLMLHIDLTMEKRCTAGKLVFLLSADALNSLIRRVDEFVTGLTG